MVKQCILNDLVGLKLFFVSTLPSKSKHVYPNKEKYIFYVIFRKRLRPRVGVHFALMSRSAHCHGIYNFTIFSYGLPKITNFPTFSYGLAKITHLTHFAFLVAALWKCKIYNFNDFLLPALQILQKISSFVMLITTYH